MAMDAAQRRAMLTVCGLVLAVGTAVSVWREQRDGALGPDLARLARAGDIHMVSSLTCVYCTRARQWLNEHRVAHSECFIERDAACLAQYQAHGGPGTPLLLVRGQAQLGFSPPQVLERLQAAR
ncbi:MAG: hypothetical protein KBC73_06825 [Burkholderiaceae bacterium]|nr:hypothetical protein [Burkholderiaceae bacterium]